MSAPLTPSQIDDELQMLSGWEFARDEIGRDTILCKVNFADFSTAWGFLTRVAILTEQVNHHAEIHNVYNRVRITLTTHDLGNKVSDLDIHLAKRINQIMK
jgi:4a-hydroxytetrahydrobiopterin dehydratase